MGNLALYAENKILELITGKTAFSTPTAYVALFTVTPTHEDGTGGTEASAGNYIRKSTAGGDWEAAASGAIQNGNDVTFIECAGTNWGTINGFAIYDAESGGNMLGWSALGAAKTINIGDTAKFAAGDFDITCN